MLLTDSKKALTQNSFLDLDMTESIKSIRSREINQVQGIIQDNNSINSFIGQNIKIKVELIKIMFIGITNIGKTSLISNYLDDVIIDKKYVPTVGMEISKISKDIFGKQVKNRIYRH